MKRDTHVSVRLPAPLALELRRIALAEDRSVGSIIRLAVVDWLEERDTMAANAPKGTT